MDILAAIIGFSPATILLLVLICILKEVIINMIKPRNKVLFEMFSTAESKFGLCIFSGMLIISEIIMVSFLNNQIEHMLAMVPDILTLMIVCLVTLLIQILLFGATETSYRLAYLADIANYGLRVRKSSLYEMFSVLFIMLCAIINTYGAYAYIKYKQHSLSLMEGLCYDLTELMQAIVIITCVYWLITLINAFLIDSRRLHIFICKIGI